MNYKKWNCSTVNIAQLEESSSVQYAQNFE